MKQTYKENHECYQTGRTSEQIIGRKKSGKKKEAR
jgi:hypothetical protein